MDMCIQMLVILILIFIILISYFIIDYLEAGILSWQWQSIDDFVTGVTS